MPMASYKIRITLNGVTPPIWRLIHVPAEGTFEDLHNWIQGAMGWSWSHLWEFQKGDKTLLRPILDLQDWDDANGRFIVINAIEEPLTNHLKKGMTLTYVYDIGDDWSHKLEVEDVLTEDIDLPTCLDGERSCPPENCGGAHGYEMYLKLIGKKKLSAGDRDHLEFLGLESEWDTEHFTIDMANDAMVNPPEDEFEGH